MTTAKPTQDNAWGEAWGEATHRLASGEARLVGLWADGAEARMALSAGRPELEFFRYAARRRFVSLGRRDACAGDPPRARDRRPQRAEGARRARSRGLGSTTAAGRSRIRLGPARPRAAASRSATPSSAPKGSGCTRFRSGRCTPGSSSRAISASTPAARRSCGWRSGSATSTRASSVCWRAPISRAALSSPAGSAATARSPTRSPSPAPSKRRAESSRRRGRRG